MSEPRVALMVITDGRWDYLAETLASLEQHCDFPFAQRLISVDSDLSSPSGLPESQVTEAHGRAEELGYQWRPHPRAGLAGNIQHGWDALDDDIDYVFHLEDDFTFPGPVPVREMLSALHAYPSLAQVALKRQPWSPEEQAAGNMLLLIPGMTQADNLCFHENLFTFNPCLYPRAVTQYGAGLERELTDKLLADGWQFAYYGGKHDPPRCVHIGHRRSQGYRW